MQIQRFNCHRSLRYKKSTILCVLAVFLLTGSGLFAQALTPTWVRQAQGSNDDRGDAVAYDGSGGVYAAGVFHDTFTFDAGGANEVVMTDALAGMDAYIAHYSADGTFNEAIQIVLANNIQIRSMVFDTAMNLVIGGRLSGVAVFGTGQGNETSVTSTGTIDAFIARYDADGVLEWVQLYGEGEDEEGLDVAVNSSGHAVLGGEMPQADGSSYMFVASYDDSGTLNWSIDAGPESGYNYRSAASVAIDEAGNVSVISQQSPSSGLLTDSYITLRKYDNTGSLIWDAPLLGHLPGPIAFNGNDLIASTREIDTYVLGQDTESDFHLQYFSVDGSMLWTDRGSGALNDRTTDIFVDDDYIYFTGYFQDDLTLGEDQLNETTLNAGDLYSIFTAKYHKDGLLYWLQHIGDNELDNHYALAVEEGKMVMLGGFYPDIVIGAETLTSAGATDVFLAQFEIMDPVISGIVFFYPSHVRMQDVNIAFSGLGSMLTDSEGMYSFEVPYGWSGTTTPTATGFTFDDTSHSYVNVIEDQIVRDFWEEGDPVVQFSGRVAFSPSDVPMENVLLTFSNGGGTVLTDTLGRYEMQLPYLWAGMVVPELSSFVFDPLDRTNDPLTEYLYDQDFVVYSDAEVELSGKVYFSPGGEAVDEVLISASGTEITMTTGEDGLFSFYVPYRWSGQLTASKEGYDFDPSFRPFDELITNNDDQDFWVAGKPIVTIAGRLLGLSGQGIEGATVNNGDGLAVTTDADGEYEFEVPYVWTGTITPSFGDYIFDPPSREYISIKVDSLDHDYQTLGPANIDISGKIEDPEGSGVDAVTLNYGVDLSTQTDEDGLYTITVENGWSGQVSVEKADFIFTPIMKTYASLDTHQVNQDYAMLGPANVVISGHALNTAGEGIDSVRLTYGTPVDTAYTDVAGVYSITVPFDWSGSIIPFKEGHEFTPDQRSYSNLRNHRADQDFNLTGTPMFDISGEITMHSSGPAAGIMVVVGDHLDTTYTNLQGQYQFQIPLGWTGAITPQHNDWLFSPTERNLTSVDQHIGGENFVALGPSSLTISGKAYFQGGSEPIEGVVLHWGVEGDSIITGEDGVYSITVANGWSGTVMPGKLNHIFDPGSRSYSILRSHQGDQDFWVEGTPTIAITGTISDRDDNDLENVWVVYSATDSVQTDENGSYTIVVPYAWSGTVMPHSDGVLYDPPSRSYSIIKTNQTDQDFTNLGPANISISGRLYFHPGNEPIEGAVLRWGVDSDSVFTDAAGQYVIQVANDWSGTIIPEKAGFNFEPSFRPYTHIVSHLTGQDFWVNAPATVTISGFVTDNNDELQEDVILKYSEADSVLTNEDGEYTITVSYGWTGTVTAIKGSWHIEPASRDYEVLVASVSDQDYKLMGPSAIHITGEVLTAAGAVVANATVYYGLTGDSTLTDNNGLFDIIIGYGWTGSIRPEKEGSAFSPPIRNFTDVQHDWTGQDFTAYPEDAPRVLIVSSEVEADLVVVLNELEYYQRKMTDLPTDVATYDLIIFADSGSARPGQLPIIPGYVSGGGAVVLMNDTPMHLADAGLDLSSISSWFGASLQMHILSGDASLSVGQPFGAALAENDVLVTLDNDTAYAVGSLEDDVIRLGSWNAETDAWQSYIRVYNNGKIGYWSKLDLSVAENTALFSAMLEWCIDMETAVEKDVDEIITPDSFKLLPAYPNPFNPTTTVSYMVAEAGRVKLEVFDMSGRCVAVLEDAMRSVGAYRLMWHAKDQNGNAVASGMYFIRMTAGRHVEIQKLIFLK